jgi:arylsulfatase A-like enzyme
VTRNGVPLPSEITTLAEVFREAGYATAAFVSSVVLAPRFGWEQGFEHYDAAFPKSRETVRDRSEFWKDQDIEGFDRRAADTNALAIPWLRLAAEPFFLFVHSFDPHAPYEGAPEYLNYVPIAFSQKTATAHVAVEGTEEQQTALRSFRRAVSKAVRHYHAEVLQTDTEVGHLLAVLGALKIRSRTLVVLTSDHGEGLGQHGLLDHAAHLYGEQLRVPLIVSGAGVAKPGLRIPTPVGLVDLAPTLATLAGLSFPEPTDGRSLATTIQAGTEL